MKNVLMSIGLSKRNYVTNKLICHSVLDTESRLNHSGSSGPDEVWELACKKSPVESF